MTVTLCSPVLGLAVGAPYTGNLEAWLVSEGYAVRATPIAYADSFAVSPAATAGAVTGSADAVNIVTGGVLTLEVDGHNRHTVALAAADTPAAVVTKISTALGSAGTASLVSGDLRISSDSTGSLSSVKVVSGTGTVLANLFLTAGQFGRGTDGNDNPTDYTGDITVDGFNTLDAGGKADGVLQVSDPTVATNREAPKWPSSTESVNIANDADHLNDASNPHTPTYTIDGNADGDTVD